MEAAERQHDASAPASEYEILFAELPDGDRISVQRKNLLYHDFSVDTCLFEEDYTVAASTGLNVWEGGWRLVDLLKGPLLDAVRGKQVVELGAGTGLAGLCAAALGAHVLLTDLPSIVWSLSENIALNTASTEGGHASGSVWSPSFPIGRHNGTAATSALDWTRTIDEQVGEGCADPRHADVILAAETVWLEELVEPFVRTVVEILRALGTQSQPGEKKCIMAYRERTSHNSESFAGAKALLAAFRREGCTVSDIGHSFGEQIKVHCVQLPSA